MNFFRFLFSKTFLMQLVLAIIISVILVFLTLKWLNGKTSHGDTIAVPDLSELSLEKVENQLDELKLRMEVLDSTSYNPDAPKYSVLEQNPEAGKQVKENRKIYVKINPSGFPKVEIPDLIRSTKRQVIPTLESMGFEIGDITYKNDLAKDAVLEMKSEGKRINPGDELKKTAVIDLVLGDGDPNGEKEKKKKKSKEESSETSTEESDSDLDDLELD